MTFLHRYAQIRCLYEVGQFWEPTLADAAASATGPPSELAAAATGRDLSQDELANLAGRASGSAARSLYGGYVELENAGEHVAVKSLRDEESWPLTVVVAITSAAPKPVCERPLTFRGLKRRPFNAVKYCPIRTL